MQCVQAMHRELSKRGENGHAATEEGVGDTYWKHSRRRLSFGGRPGGGCVLESLKKERRESLRTRNKGG